MSIKASRKKLRSDPKALNRLLLLFKLALVARLAGLTGRPGGWQPKKEVKA